MEVEIEMETQRAKDLIEEYKKIDRRFNPNSNICFRIVDNRINLGYIHPGGDGRSPLTQWGLTHYDLDRFEHVIFMRSLNLNAS